MIVEGCPLPEDRRYDLEEGVWFRPDPGGRTGRFGILASSAAFAGRFTSVVFRPLAGEVRRGRSVATIESVRSVAPVRAPLDGRLIGRNEELARRPRLLNDAPYDAGWVAEIAPTDPGSAERELETAGAIAGRLAERIRRDRILCLPAVADEELFEIGAECQAVLVRLDEALDRLAPGDVVHLVTDDPTAPIEMVRWHDRSGHTVLDHRRDGALHHFLIRKARTASGPTGRP